MPKIPCPSCREPNFDTDIVCWKCGEPLRTVDGPEVFQPKHTVQMNISAPRASDAGDVQVPVSRSDLALALMIGAVTGILASILINIPFLLWVKASYIPYVEAVPFMAWMAAAGALAGALSVTFRLGILAGAILYDMTFLGILGYSTLSPITIPPTLGILRGHSMYGTYYLVSGALCSGAGLLSSRLAFRCLGRIVVIPIRSGLSSFARSVRMDRLWVAVILFLLVFALDAWRYVEKIRSSAYSPTSVAMRYCEAMASSPSGDLSRVQPMLMKGLTERLSRDPSARSSLNPGGILSSREVVDQIRQRRVLSATENVDPIYRTAEVDIEVRGPATSGAGGAKPTGQPIHLFFELGYSNGKWMIAQPPRYPQDSR